MKTGVRIICWLTALCWPVALYGQAHSPAPDPPTVTVSTPDRGTPPHARPHPKDAPSTEWTLHKTSDGAHPSGEEQQMMWLMNRARQSPRPEGVWLAHLRDEATQQALQFYAVNREVLMAELASWASSNPAPAAFDARLYRAASNHCAYLISIDGQNHDGQFDRVTNESFNVSSWRGSVFAYAYHPLYAHAAFNVDWGNSENGMQNGRAHRTALMMGQMANAGIAFVAQPDENLSIGPNVVTINYAIAQTFYTNHYNRFVVGTVWHDANTNRLYDPGEGCGDITVTPDHGPYYAITGDAGGYAIPITTAGVYTLTFSGGALASNHTTSVTVDTHSVLADLELNPPPLDFAPTPAFSANQQLTYTLPDQRLGIPYILLETPALVTNDWTWTGVLPTGYSNTLTYQLPFITNAARRFVTLQGWPDLRGPPPPPRSTGRLVRHAERNMHRRRARRHRLQMHHLVVKENMGLQNIEHPLFLNAAHQENFVRLQPQRRQRIDEPLMGGRAARRDNGNPQKPLPRRVSQRALTVQLLEIGNLLQQRHQRPRLQRPVPVVHFILPELLQILRALIHLLGLVIHQHPVKIERQPELLVALVILGVTRQNVPRRIAQIHGLLHLRAIGAQIERRIHGFHERIRLAPRHEKRARDVQPVLAHRIHHPHPVIGMITRQNHHLHPMLFGLQLIQLQQPANKRKARARLQRLVPVLLLIAPKRLQPLLHIKLVLMRKVKQHR